MAERSMAANVGGVLTALALLISVCALLMGVVAVAFNDDHWQGFALVMLGAAALLVVCGTVLLAVGERKKT